MSSRSRRASGGSAVTIERSAVAGLSAARTGAFDVVVAGTQDGRAPAGRW